LPVYVSLKRTSEFLVRTTFRRCYRVLRSFARDYSTSITVEINDQRDYILAQSIIQYRDLVLQASACKNS